MKENTSKSNKSLKSVYKILKGETKHCMIKHQTNGHRSNKSISQIICYNIQFLKFYLIIFAFSFLIKDRKLTIKCVKAFRS